jgi:hypothetical protein
MFDEIRILFGKTYRGRRWDDPAVSQSWLEWVAENFNQWRFRDRAQRELVRRQEERESRGYGRFSISQIDPNVVVEVVKAGRKKLAQVHHPDAGGDGEYMKRVNRVCDALLEKFR